MRPLGMAWYDIALSKMTLPHGIPPLIVMQPEVWYVYIMTNHTNTVLYTGVTNDLVTRIHEHRSGVGSKFTKKYRVYKLVWFEEFESPVTAIEMEKRIKGWRREKKVALIESVNPRWIDLARELPPSFRNSHGRGLS